MQFLSIALLTLCALPQGTEPPTTEQVEATVADLKEAFAKGEVEERIEAVAKASSVPDKEVAKWVARGLSDSDETVVVAAIESLRFMDHPAALDQLHGTYKRDRKLRSHETLAGALLRAIGQHGDPSSIPVLADAPFSTINNPAIRARILGLGNIRDEQSVEELMGLMKKVSRHELQPFMGEFRLALMRLTGHDEGKSVDLWMKWWNNNKRTFEVAEQPPKLPRVEQVRWDDYWGNEMPRQRSKKRGDRGDD